MKLGGRGSAAVAIDAVSAASHPTSARTTQRTRHMLRATPGAAASGYRRGPSRSQGEDRKRRTPGDAWSPGAAFTSDDQAHVAQQSPHVAQHVGPHESAQHAQVHGPSQPHEPVSQQPQQPSAAHAPEVPVEPTPRKGEPTRAAHSTARDKAIFMDHLLKEMVWNERNRDRPRPIQFRHTPRRMRIGRRGTSGMSMRTASRSPWPASRASHGVGAGPRRSTAGPCGEAKGSSSRGSHWHRQGDGWSSVACGPQDAVATQAGHVSGARSATQAPQASARVEEGVAHASHRATATTCSAMKATQASNRAVVEPVRDRMPCMGAFVYGRRLLNTRLFESYAGGRRLDQKI